MADDFKVSKPTGKNYLKFIIPSLIGAFLFLTPWPVGEAFNIPLGIVIDWLKDILGQFNLASPAVAENIDEKFGIQYMIGLVAVTIAFVGMVLATLFKVGFIMDRPTLKKAFYTPSPIYFISKTIGFAIIWMIFLNIGPAFVISSGTGDVMVTLFAALVVIFIILLPGIPLLTDFGLMEFIGIFIKKVVRALFTLPGRASIDLVASWFGSSVVAVLISRMQHEKGFYTNREAAVATSCFAIVSVPFTFVVVSTLELTEHFFLFYFIMAVTVLFLAILLPRIWPLRNIPDTYLEGVEKQFVEEHAPPNVSAFSYATQTACARAEKMTLKDFKNATLNGYAGIFFDLLPIILAWGTLAMIVNEHTPIFDWISWPMAQLLQLLRVEAAVEFAPATIIGFVDMFLPALMLRNAPLETQMILGILSIVQVIYMAEVGVLILRSKIPLGFGKLFALFVMRTLIGLPIIVALVKLML